MPVMQSPPGAETVIDGRRYLYFAGTGYLGLQGHAAVIRAACEATERYGIGSATSRSGVGDTPPVLAVEREAAALFGTDDSFYFVSGYVGNHILILLLEGSFDAVFVDELSHYCVFEAARLSGRPVFPFRHRDADALGESLKKNLEPGRRPLVTSDGVFAGLGRIAPVAEYRDVLRNYPGAIVCLDDAHAVGVLGAGGRGTYEHAGLMTPRVNSEEWRVESGESSVESRESRVESRVWRVESREWRVESGEGSQAGGEPRLCFCGTLSKAVGGFGGIIPGSRPFIDRLRAESHYYDGASALPVPAAAATARALELIQNDPGMRTRLWKNVQRVKSGLRRLGLETDDTPVPIVCLRVGSAENMRRIARGLAARDVFVAYRAAYAGLPPEGALRLAVFSTHTDEMIERLLEELGRLV